MKRLLLCVCLVAVGCTGLNALQRAQLSHDSLALAQDTEASLCWGLPSVSAAIATNVTPNHCTAPTATTIGLTDQRHQQINQAFKKAFDDHAAYTRLSASGSHTLDSATVQSDIAAILTLVSALSQGNADVSKLTVQLQKAKGL